MRNKNQQNLSAEELAALKMSLEDIQRKIQDIYQTLEQRGLLGSQETIEPAQIARGLGSQTEDTPQGRERVIEGVFDGQNMVGPDGKQYSVPANYASKSKLVEGDILKLTITPQGSFIYKQIEPITRRRLMGTLGYNEATGQYQVVSNEGSWLVVTASVTYFKGQPGDEVVILVPQKGKSKWAAVENIIHTN